MRQEIKDRLKRVTDWATGKTSLGSSEPIWREIGPPRLGKEIAAELLSEHGIEEETEDQTPLRRSVAGRLRDFRKEATC